MQQSYVTVLQTYEYDIFNRFEFNREIKKSHVELLKASMKQENRLHLHPLIVDKDYNIIDGQHRLEAAKSLNIPVYYIVDKNATDQSILIDQFVNYWKSQDYINFYAKRGKPEYVKFLEVMKKYDLTHTQMYSINCFNNHDCRKATRLGRLKVKERALLFLNDCEKVIDFLKKETPLDIRNSVNSSDFIVALYCFWNTFPDKIKSLGENMIVHFPKIVLKGNKLMYLKCLVDIYNHAKKHSIRYRSIEELKLIFM